MPPKKQVTESVKDPKNTPKMKQENQQKAGAQCTISSNKSTNIQGLTPNGTSSLSQPKPSQATNLPDMSLLTSQLPNANMPNDVSFGSMGQFHPPVHTSIQTVGGRRVASARGKSVKGEEGKKTVKTHNHKPSPSTQGIPSQLLNGLSARKIARALEKNKGGLGEQLKSMGLSEKKNHKG
jgi:hypothetical protein